MDKYMIGESSNEFRKTICQCRRTKQYFDLGEENWTRQTLRQQRRLAMPSHIMICIFGNQVHEGQADPSDRHPDPVRSGIEELQAEPEASQFEPSSKICQNAEEQPTELSGVPVPAWSPQSSNNPGPKFLSLDRFQQSLIKRIHNNLGHPTAEKLAAHLKRLKFSQELIDGAGDYLCQSCSERVGPKLTTPGKLKEPKEFNEVITLDGFEWKSSSGQKYYVIHIFDEATHFHLGRRCNRGTEEAEKVISETWMHWAGPPKVIVHDLAGEFVSQHWKNFIQQNGIQPVTSAAPWQRGRIERHGGTVKEMLSRIDNHSTIKSDKEFDFALNQCFQAKNSMSVVNGSLSAPFLSGGQQVDIDKEVTSSRFRIEDETQSVSAPPKRFASLKKNTSGSYGRALFRAHSHLLLVHVAGPSRSSALLQAEIFTIKNSNGNSSSMLPCGGRKGVSKDLPKQLV